jgi:hypothetical protein
MWNMDVDASNSSTRIRQEEDQSRKQEAKGCESKEFKAGCTLSMVDVQGEFGVEQHGSVWILPFASARCEYERAAHID